MDIRKTACLIVSFLISQTLHAESALDYFRNQALQKKFAEANAALLSKDYLKAASIYKQCGDAGDKVCQYQLGVFYLKGWGVVPDDKNAQIYFAKSAELGFPKAQTALGIMFYGANDVEKARTLFGLAAASKDPDAVFMQAVLAKIANVQPSTVMGMYENASVFNSSQAQYNLGLNYYLGLNVKKDLNKALNYFELSAKNNNAKAKAFLGTIYAAGLNGLIPDKTKGFLLLKDAASQNLPYALYNLSIMYYNGWGTQSDLNLSVDLLTKAANGAFPHAEYFLGHLHQKGISFPRNPDKALEYFQKSALHGSADAQFALGAMYHLGDGIAKNDVNAFEWYEAAAKQGMSKAQYMTGYLYQSGLGKPQDYTKAAYWYGLAAAQGLDNAQLLLGTMYSIGQGVAKDDQLAYAWLDLASTSSDPGLRASAIEVRDKLAKMMKPEQIQSAKELGKNLYQKYAGGSF